MNPHTSAPGQSNLPAPDLQEALNEAERRIAEREYGAHIGADAEYRPCGWCGGLVAVAMQGGRALYHYRPLHREYVHPGCLAPVVWAESN